MKLLPVVERELRTIARRPSAYWVRSASAMAAFLAIGYVALVGATGLPTASQGRSLFDLLSLGAFIYCALAGVKGTSDALSAEKREGTLGLLFLTDLKGYDVVLGKLVSVSINSIYGILAVAPPLALAFMMGGTSGTQFLVMLLLLFNTLFFSLSVGIFVSTFSEQERPAMGMTLAAVFVTLVMPYAIAMAHTFGILEIWEVLDSGFLIASPAFAYWTAKNTNMLAIYADDVALSLAFTHLMGWLCLVVASASIAQRAYAEAPRSRVTTWFIRIRQEWAYGKATRRRAIRASLLDRNAFAWLAGRDRLKQRYAWIFLALLGGLWAIGRWKAPEITEEWTMTMFSLWFLHLFFKVWVASEVAARFIEDRRSNGLELLLTTPLLLREFASGSRLALFRQFGAPLAAIVFLDLYVGIHASDSSSYLIRSPQPLGFFIAGLIHLVVDLYAIHWIAIWRSMHLRGTNRAITQTVGLVVFLPVLGWFFIWQGGWILEALARRVTSASDILWIWTILCVAYDLLLAFVARNAFYRDFRELATQAFDKPKSFRWKLARPLTPPPARARAPKGLTTRFNRMRKVAIVAVVLFGCLYVGVSIRRHRLDKEIAARMYAIRISGLPLHRNDVPRWRVGPSASESATMVLRQASKAFASATRPMHLTDAFAQWNSDARLRPDIKETISTWITNNAQIFEILERLRTRKPGGAGFEENWISSGIAADEIVRVLQTKARIEMEDDPRAAAKTIALLLYCARDLQAENLATFAASKTAMNAAKELLERAAVQKNFSADDWRAWKKILGPLEPVGELRAHLIIERANGLEVFSLPVEIIYQRFGRQFGDFPGLFNFTWSIRRFFGQDKAEVVVYLDEMSRAIATVDQPFWIAGGHREKWQAPSLASSTFIAPQILMSFDWLYEIATETTALQRIILTACDVEIFRASNQRLPKFEVTTRVDPFSGNQLVYLLRDKGYSIYSTGPDRLDEGGVRSTRRNQGDIAFDCGPPLERARIIKKP